MTGSHEVRGSIPLSSTKKIKGLRQSDDNPFLLENPKGYHFFIFKKRQRGLEWLDEKVLAFYPSGINTREIRGRLEKLYGVEVSPTLNIQCYTQMQS